MTTREFDQLSLANRLLRTMVQFLFAAAALEIPAIMEHPRQPSEPHMPSAWQLPEIRLLSQQGCAKVVHIDQCQTGSSWVKPTTFLTIHAPALHDMVQQLPNRGQCNHSRASHARLAGRDRLTGRWETAKAKEYPATLCRLLAAALCVETGARFPSASVAGEFNWKLPADYAVHYQPSDPYIQRHMAHDCMLFSEPPPHAVTRHRRRFKQTATPTIQPAPARRYQRL